MDEILDPAAASILSDAGPAPDEQAQILATAEQSGVNPGIVALDPSAHKARVFDEATYRQLVIDNPRLAASLGHQDRIHVIKDDIKTWSDMSSFANAMRPRDQLPWGTAIREFAKTGLLSTGKMIAGAAAGIEYGLAGAASALGADVLPPEQRLFGRAALWLYDQQKASEAEIGQYRQTGLQKFVAQPIVSVATDPANLILPVVGARTAIAGARAIKGITEAQVALKGLNGAAMMSAALSSSQTLSQNLEKNQEEGRSFVRAQDIADTAVQGLASYFFTKWGGLTSELQMAGANTGKGFVVDTLRDIASESGESATQAASSAVFQGEGGVQDIIVAGIQGGVGVAPLGLFNIRHQFANKMANISDQAALGHDAIVSASNIANVLNQLNNSPSVARLEPAVQAQRELISRALGEENGTARIDAKVFNDYFTKAGVSADEVMKRAGGVMDGTDIRFDTATLFQMLYKTSSDLLVEHAKVGQMAMSGKEGIDFLNNSLEQAKQLDPEINAALKSPMLPSGAKDDSLAIIEDLNKQASETIRDQIIGNVVRGKKQYTKDMLNVTASAYRSMAESINQAAGSVVTTPKQLFDEFGVSIAKEGDTLKGKAVRGTYDRDARVVALSKTSDASSFPHEMSHHFLQLLDFASKKVPGENSRFTQDWASIRKHFSDNVAEVISSSPEADRKHIEKMGGAEWLKAEINKDFSAADAVAAKSMHEYFARGFEKWMAGEYTPKPSLRRLFIRLAEYIKSVYHDLRALNVTLSPEIKQVYGRLVTIDSEVQAELDNAPRPLFISKPEGMDEAVWQKYLAYSQERREQVTERELLKIKREMHARTSAASQQEDHDNAVADVSALPIYRAQSQIVGSGEKIDAKIMEERYGKAVTEWAVQNDLAGENGTLDIDEVAQNNGYPSGKELAAAWPSKPIEEAIEDRYLELRAMSGGEKSDAEAVADITNDYLSEESIARVAQVELGALLSMRRKGLQPIAEAKGEAAKGKAIRQQAAVEMVRPMTKVEKALMAVKVRDRLMSMTEQEIRTGKFRQQADVNAKKATVALANDDVDGAVTAKSLEVWLREMDVQAKDLMGELKSARHAIKTSETREARAVLTNGSPWVTSEGEVFATEDLAKANVDHLNKGKVAGQPMVTYASSELYLRASEAIKGLFSFGNAPLPAGVRSVRDMINAMLPDQPAFVPDSVADRKDPVRYQDLTAQEILDVGSALSSIYSTANRTNELNVGDKKRSLGSVIEQIKRYVTEQGPYAKIDRDTLLGKAELVLNELQRLSDMVNGMDKGNEAGLWNDLIVAPVEKALGNLSAMNDKYFGEYNKLTEMYTNLERRKTMKVKTKVEGVPGEFSHWDKLAIAQQWGRAEGRQRVMDSLKLTEPQVVTLLNTLDARDIQFVNGYHALTESIRPLVGGVYQRLNEPTPRWSETVGQELANGTLTGGYAHIAYTDERAAVVENPLEEVRTGEALKRYNSNGFTKDVLKSVQGRTLDLSPDVQMWHLRSVLRDVALRETAVDLWKIVGTNTQPGQIIANNYGNDVLTNLQRALSTAVVGPPQAQLIHEQAFRFLRTNVTNATLAFNAFSAVSQLTGYASALAHPAVRGGIKTALARFHTDPKATIQFVYDNSVKMRERAEKANVDQSDAMEANKTLPFGKFISKYGYYGIRKIQALVDVPTWVAAYEHYSKTESHAKAAQLADRLVSDIMGGHRTTDITALQRSELGRFVFMFASFKIAILNSVRASLRRNLTTKEKRNTLRFAGEMFGFVAAPMLLYVGAQSVLKGAQWGPDDEGAMEWAKWSARMMLAETAGLAPLTAPIANQLTGIPSSNAAARPIEAVGKVMYKLLSPGDEDISADIVYDIFRSGQLFTGAASEQVIRSIKAYNSRESNPAGLQTIIFGEVPRSKQ